MKRGGFTFWQLLAVLLFLGATAAVLFPMFARSPGTHHGPSCQSNLKQLGLAFLQYREDYDSRLPLIRVHPAAVVSPHFDKPYGWADAIFPYLKARSIYFCPVLKRDEQYQNKYQAQDAITGSYTDFYYNSNLDGVQTRLLPAQAVTILTGEGNDGIDRTNARYNRNRLPAAWANESRSPARRHLDGANYAFVDGHVKWLKPGQVKAGRASKDDYSFAVR